MQHNPPHTTVLFVAKLHQIKKLGSYLSLNLSTAFTFMQTHTLHIFNKTSELHVGHSFSPPWHC
jgi:hypothetical protein